MPTRFYLSTSPHSFVVTPQAAWERSIAAATTWRSSTTKRNTALADTAALFGSTATSQTRWMSFATPPLTAAFSFAITDTFSMVIRGIEGAINEDCHLAYQLRVIARDGTERGLLAGSMGNATELTNAAETRIFSAVAMTAVSALRGDRLVLEIGCHGVTPNNAANVTWRFGDPSATGDFALTSGLTTDLCPWWEISATPSFATSDYLVDPAGAPPAATGTLARQMAITAPTLTGAAPAPTGTLARLLAALRAVAGAPAAPAATLVGTKNSTDSRARVSWVVLEVPAVAGPVTRDVAGALPAPTATLGRLLAAPRSLAGALPAAAGTLGRLLAAPRALAGALPAASGTLTRSQAFLRDLAGALPAAAATLVGQISVSRSLAGALPAAAGTLVRLLAAARAVAGAQPAATGTLARRLDALRAALAGALPAPAGTLARLLQALRTLAGAPAAPTGTLARAQGFLRSLAGAFPAAAGTLAAGISVSRSLAGAFPAAAGTLSRVLVQVRTLAGAFPAPTGTLARRLAALRSVLGAAPAPQGVLARRAATTYTPALAGTFPEANGILVRQAAVSRALAGAFPAAGATLDVFQGHPPVVKQPSRCTVTTHRTRFRSSTTRHMAATVGGAARTRIRVTR